MREEHETLIFWGSAAIAIVACGSIYPNVIPLEASVKGVYDYLPSKIVRQTEAVARVVVPVGLKGYKNFKIVQEKVSKLFYNDPLFGY
jgi:hypothetical protein